jgi:hypothetical protein
MRGWALGSNHWTASDLTTEHQPSPMDWYVRTEWLEERRFVIDFCLIARLLVRDPRVAQNAIVRSRPVE